MLKLQWSYHLKGKGTTSTRTLSENSSDLKDYRGQSLCSESREVALKS